MKRHNNETLLDLHAMRILFSSNKPSLIKQAIFDDLQAVFILDESLPQCTYM